MDVFTAQINLKGQGVEIKMNDYITNLGADQPEERIKFLNCYWAQFFSIRKLQSHVMLLNNASISRKKF